VEGEKQKLTIIIGAGATTGAIAASLRKSGIDDSDFKSSDQIMDCSQ
jgi:uncharacterized membrane protein